ncbi:hypothetical protein [Sphingomonas sp. 3-13AW]|jgi:hypothetical protein|uniref:hypothetical protein n=1 Tax=Sphingomonas sp. 3-13AW TaxID=3050450 RepID=UPI003BB69E06
MNGFEFLFSFYGLLLGLAVANVTSSFADTWRRRGNWTIGIVPPLLGLFILLAVAQQWGSFWNARDNLTMGPWEMLVSMAMALPYIFVSHAMFPGDLQEGGSLEAHYFGQRHVILGTLLVPPLVSATYNIILVTAPSLLDYFLFAGAVYGPRLGIPIVLMFWRNPWAHRIGFALLSMWLLFLMFV